MRSLINHLVQIPGWKSKRKFFVIESDDWGSVRMSSEKDLKVLLDLGLPIQNDLYNRYDSLEIDSDMIELFQTLTHIKDSKNQHPVITANTVMANPDWDKIRNSNFTEFYFENFTETLNYNPNSRGVFNLYHEGIESGLFYPQFHGREHLNVKFWLDSLAKGDEYILAGFNQKVFGVPLKNSTSNRNNVMASFDFMNHSELEGIVQSIKEGLDMFENHFKYRSNTIISPCYVWSNQILGSLRLFGIEGIQGIKYQFEPRINSKKYKKIFHYTGEKNSENQLYLVRNVFFEPTHFYLGNPNYINKLMNDIRRCYSYNNPVIMGAHRINFMGGLNESNRKVNLNLLSQLLRMVVEEFPDVEFVSSSQLLKIIQNDKI